MNANEEIRVASWDDEPKISAMMCLAFASDPMVRRLFPSPSDYLAASVKYAGQSSGPAFDGGSAYIIGDMVGAALWLPPDVRVDQKTGTNNTTSDAESTVFDDFRLLLANADSYRPDEPHWCLSLLAVDPIQRGRGYGAALISYGLDICDLDKCPIYLESTNAANISLYRRCGFELLAEVRVNEFVRYPMLRQSQ